MAKPPKAREKKSHIEEVTFGCGHKVGPAAFAVGLPLRIPFFGDLGVDHIGPLKGLIGSYIGGPPMRGNI